MSVLDAITMCPNGVSMLKPTSHLSNRCSEATWIRIVTASPETIVFPTTPSRSSSSTFVTLIGCASEALVESRRR